MGRENNFLKTEIVPSPEVIDLFSKYTVYHHTELSENKSLIIRSLYPSKNALTFLECSNETTKNKIKDSIK